MKMKKTAVKIAALLMILGSLSTTAFAFGAQGPIKAPVGSGIITPQWTNISTVVPSISASGNTLYPEAYVKAKSSTAKISGTLYLEKYAGGTWTTVNYWSFSGTGSVSVSKSHSGSANTEYRTRIIVTVGSEMANVTSASCKT